MSSDIRWRQRFDNFDRAFVLLREVYERKLDSLSRLEKEGAIQRFKVAFKLAWKTIKDYLEESGVVVDPVTPEERHQGGIHRQATGRCGRMDRHDGTSQSPLSSLRHQGVRGVLQALAEALFYGL